MSVSRGNSGHACIQGDNRLLFWPPVEELFVAHSSGELDMPCGDMAFAEMLELLGQGRGEQ